MSSGGNSILVVGDVFLDRDSPEEAFSRVHDQFDRADLIIGNYEGTLSNSGLQRHFYPWISGLHSPPSMVEGLDVGGFDVLSLANNQSMNYGPEGLIDSMDLFQNHGITVVGAGTDDQSASLPAVQSVGGLDVAIIGSLRLGGTGVIRGLFRTKPD